jgi:hypothetical protein
VVWTALGGLPSRAWLATLGVGVVAAATWYLLPVFSGDHGDVAVYGGDTIESSIDGLSYQLRDRGRNVSWVAAGSTWCELAEVEFDVDDVDVVVLAPEALGACGGNPVATTIDRLHGKVQLVIVALGRAAEATSVKATDRVTMVDPAALLGADGTITMPCEWWDNCVGTIAVRTDSGDLTDAGRERMARMVSAAIG